MDLVRFAPFFLLYAVASVLSLRATDRARSARDQRLWRILALLLALLLAEKALEQSLLHGLTKLAVSKGWYEYRRYVQVALVGIAVIAGAGIATRIWARWGSNAAHALALGLVLLAYAVVRAISYHPIDAVLALHLGPVLLRHLIEGALIVVISGLALSERR